MSNLKPQIIQIVKQIPENKVMYFGQIGQKLGVSGQVIGWILSGMSQTEWDLCPWYRVVAKNGFISSLKLGAKGLIQKTLLEEEGYNIIGDCVDLHKHLWVEDNLDNVDSLFD